MEKQWKTLKNNSALVENYVCIVRGAAGHLHPSSSLPRLFLAVMPEGLRVPNGATECIIMLSLKLFEIIWTYLKSFEYIYFEIFWYILNYFDIFDIFRQDARSVLLLGALEHGCSCEERSLMVSDNRRPKWQRGRSSEKYWFCQNTSSEIYFWNIFTYPPLIFQGLGGSHR